MKSKVLPMLAVSLLAFSAPEVLAQQALTNVQNGAATTAQQLRPGDQAFSADLDGPIDFAGKTLLFSSASAIFGMSSDLAYVMVLSGKLRLDGQKAKRGRIALIPAGGGAISVRRFDAARLVATLDETTDARARRAIARVADKQSTAKFWGFTLPTSVNVNAPGGAQTEQIKRQLTNNAAMQSVRFSGEQDVVPGQQVVNAFVRALRTRDAQSVAGLLDPSQFSNSLDMRGGADSARLAAARLLVKTVRPTAQAPTSEPVSDAPEQTLPKWEVSTASGPKTLVLRSVGNLIFVSSIS
jgi:hypothetical protein